MQILRKHMMLYDLLKPRNALAPREHEGTERDTPSHGFVICHSH